MVGVAGKSKGCNTCKKRKVRCDGEKPTCVRCWQANRVCEGYQRPRQFKNLSALDHNTLLARTQPLTSLTELSFKVYGNSSSIAEENDPISRGILNKGNRLMARDPKLREPGNAANLTDLFLNFLSNYIPEEQAGSRSVHHNKTPVSWLQAIVPLQRSHTSLGLAMSALSMVGLGRKCGDGHLRSQGLAHYGRALSDLQNALSSETLVFEEQTLASCMTLSIFEVLEVSGGNTLGWASHVEGISRLFQLRGPDLHVSGPSHHLFLGFRPTGIIHALALRNPTYLATQAWLKIPWTEQPKSDFHHLLDIMAQIPALLDQTERFDKFSNSEISLAERLQLLKQATILHLHLEDWHQGLRSAPNHSEPLYSQRTSSQPWAGSSPARSLQPVFATFLHFRTFEMARMLLFYWTGLLLLYNNILTISSSALNDGHRSTSTFASSPPLLEAVFVRRRALETATLIAQSMDYLLSDERRILGPQNVFFPLRTAMHVFSGANEYKLERWCRSVFEELDRRGYPFGKILSTWRWDDIPLFLSETLVTVRGKGDLGLGISG